jgi:pre-mRNA-splicing factor RBM22/SLT11
MRSVVCSHRSHCAFLNYIDRESAEKAAAACQGRAVVKGVPLRVQWGRPKPLDSLDRDQRLENARAGRSVAGGAAGQKRKAIEGSAEREKDDLDSLVAAPPPGQGEVEYAAMAGE